MKKSTLAVLAASTLISAPALAVGHDNGNGKSQGNAYGHDTKVCLVTFAVAGDQSNTNVVNAQYLPLRIALQKEQQNDTLSDIYVYDEDDDVEGVDHSYPNADGTEATCEMLAEMAEDRDDEDDGDE